jgi:hypothetical protein
MKVLKASQDFDLQTLVIGSHWSPRHGYTANEIAADEFKIDGQVSVFAESDAPSWGIVMRFFLPLCHVTY